VNKLEQRIGDTAKVCYEANRTYCATLGDISQPSWEDAAHWQRDSVIAGVRFHLANPGAGPEASHENWVAQKDAEGWVWAQFKNPVKKEHPCMVPFHSLPPEQQAKDVLFRAIVHALLIPDEVTLDPAGGTHENPLAE
jgi:hypothetical protein